MEKKIGKMEIIVKDKETGEIIKHVEEAENVFMYARKMVSEGEALLSIICRGEFETHDVKTIMEKTAESFKPMMPDVLKELREEQNVQKPGFFKRMTGR